MLTQLKSIMFWGACLEITKTIFKKTYPLLIMLIICSCSYLSSPPSIELGKFIDNIQKEIRKTSPINRLTIPEIINGEGDKVIEEEQNKQCSSDPTVLLWGSDLTFDLRGSIKGKGKASSNGGGISIAVSDNSEVHYVVGPRAISDLPDNNFEERLQRIQTISTLKLDYKMRQRIIGDFFQEAINEQKKLKKKINQLQKNWVKAHQCLTKKEPPNSVIK